MKIPLLPLLASGLVALAPLATHAQVTLLTDEITSFGQVRRAAEIPVTTAVADADLIAAAPALEATFALAAGFALEVLARQPLEFVGPATASESKLGLVARLALDQELSAGAFRPFVGVNVGRLYGELAREDWAAGIAAGARYFVQPRTFVRASAEYGWMFSHARGFNDRLAEGSWTWSMGLGITF